MPVDIQWIVTTPAQTRAMPEYINQNQRQEVYRKGICKRKEREETFG